MKQDERGLALSTDSAEAVAAFDRVGRAFPEIPRRHHGARRSRDRRRPWVRHGPLPEGLPAADRGEPRQSGADRCDAGRAHAGADEHHRARTAASCRGRCLASRVARRILQDLAADSRRAPTDLLAFRICDTIWFRHGQTQPILEQADRVTPRWSRRSARLRLRPDHLGLRP